MLGAQYISGWHKYKENAHSALFDVWATIKVMKATHAEYRAGNFRTTSSLIPPEISANKFVQDQGLTELVNVGILTSEDAKKLNNLGITSDRLEEVSNDGQAALENLLQAAELAQSRSDFLSKVGKIRSYMLS